MLLTLASTHTKLTVAQAHLYSMVCGRTGIHVIEVLQNVCLLRSMAAVASNMSTRYYALIAGGRRGIAGLAELYSDDSVSASLLCVQSVRLVHWNERLKVTCCGHLTS